MNVLQQFLMKNTVVADKLLPLVHSTPAGYLEDIISSDSIQASACDVFAGEKLNYFFVGRPAYKHKADPGQSRDWEFPCCFIFDYGSISGIKRIYPFDTGAHFHNLYPSYFQMMKHEHYEVSDVSDAPQKIIGAFFGSAKNYFYLNPKSKENFTKEFSLSVTETKLRALIDLAQDQSSKAVDDRRFAIEIQSDRDVELKTDKPLAVVMPSVYLDDPAVFNRVVTDWGAQPIGYSTHALNVANCYGQIYEKVFNFYERENYL